MKSVILLTITVLSNGAEGGSLLNAAPQSGSELSCCQDDNLLSCQQVNIDQSALGDDDLYLEPINATLAFEGMVENTNNSYHYGNDDVDFVITVHIETGGIYGHAALADGGSYVIEYCGDAIHVLKELDVANLGENLGVDYVEEDSNTTTVNRFKRSNDRGARDTTTIVTYTVKVYYTPQFAAVTADIQGYVDQVIAETNQGYVNSKVPLRVKAHCIEQATINDMSSASAILSAFRTMKGTVANLRGSADSAALLVRTFNSCGIGYLNTIGSGTTVSAAAKNCALGYFSFGHELGHNIGLHHNIQVATNGAFSDGHGHLIARGSASTGVRTILAYSANGHSRRVNYYSNPNVNYPGTGTPTGVTGTSNNARVLTVQRFNLARVGDESRSCSDGPSTTTTQAPASSCIVDNKYQRFSHRYQGRLTQSSCQSRCRSTTGCISWIINNRNRWCYLLMGYQTSSSSYATGPDPSQRSCNLLRSSCTSSNSITYLRYIGRRSVSSSAACETACKQTSGCTQWNFRKSSMCYLYSAYNRNISGWTSGPKYC
jgi:hypothetical protein